MRVFVCGDTHANTRFFTKYLLPVAAGVGADVVLQLGDFGYWEHTRDGVEFLDELEAVAGDLDLPVVWLRGNHDNIELLRERYYQPENLIPGGGIGAGFYQIRPNVWHVPDGTRWTWAGQRFAAFGGAYSIDKEMRLRAEAKKLRAAWAKEHHRRDTGEPPQDVADTAGTLWFPGEEMTDAQMTDFLSDTEPVDVIVSHDKPRPAGPSGFKDFPECLPNQDRLALALKALTPKLWMHGHLHHRYEMSVPTGGWDDTWCSVIGLSCDDLAAGRFWKPWHAWLVLDLADAGTPMKVTPGGHESLDAAVTRSLGEDCE